MPKKINNRWIFTKKELDGQIRQARSFYSEYIKDKPIGTSYLFDPNTRILSIRISDGSRIDFPVSKIKELANASIDAIRKGYITEAGDAIHWDNLNAHYTIAGLAANIFGTRQWMRELARIGGSKTSFAKGEAARQNGYKGGRPSKSSLIHKQLTAGKGIMKMFGRSASSGSITFNSSVNLEIVRPQEKGPSAVKPTPIYLNNTSTGTTLCLN